MLRIQIDEAQVDRVVHDQPVPWPARWCIEKLTDTMVEIEGENMRSVTWVIIEEAKSCDWGIGGQALTTDAVETLAAPAGHLPRSAESGWRRQAP